jgi:hypothetical protein
LGIETSTTPLTKLLHRDSIAIWSLVRSPSFRYSGRLCHAATAILVFDCILCVGWTPRALIDSGVEGRFPNAAVRAGGFGGRAGKLYVCVSPDHTLPSPPLITMLHQLPSAPTMPHQLTARRLPPQALLHTHLTFVVHDHDIGSSDELLGQVRFVLAGRLAGRLAGWHTIESCLHAHTPRDDAG